MAVLQHNAGAEDSAAGEGGGLGSSPCHHAGARRVNQSGTGWSQVKATDTGKSKKRGQGKKFHNGFFNSDNFFSYSSKDLS